MNQNRESLTSSASIIFKEIEFPGTHQESNLPASLRAKPLGYSKSHVQTAQIDKLCGCHKHKTTEFPKKIIFENIQQFRCRIVEFDNSYNASSGVHALHSLSQIRRFDHPTFELSNIFGTK